MDFRVKKLILEEGMKNIAETEGMKLEMNFDDLEKTITVYFYVPLQRYTGGVRKTCSYANLENASTDVFKTIEALRREVKDIKRSNRVSNSELAEYANADITNTLGWLSILRGDMRRKSSKIPKIKNVIFNYPATIVFWEDGDKTVVKCQNDDVFDAEKGLAMAIIKKMNGGKGNYCEIFKPWIEEYEKELAEALEFVICPEALSPDTDDIQDILEGKVDPLMIKVDEEIKDCRTCKHRHLRGYQLPCNICKYNINMAIRSGGSCKDCWRPKE